MRKYLILVFILILGAGAFFNSCVKKVPENIIWLEPFDQGLKSAQDQGKNLLVAFEKDG
jgi:hypothetical protein